MPARRFIESKKLIAGEVDTPLLRSVSIYADDPTAHFVLGRNVTFARITRRFHTAVNIHPDPHRLALRREKSNTNVPRSLALRFRLLAPPPPFDRFTPMVFAASPQTTE
jgi:hypothetical protein